jgi:Tfp pilus assembly protein PilN
MVEINLLPWRVKKFQYERMMTRRFMFLGIFAALLILCLIHYYLTSKLDIQANRVEQMRASMPPLVTKMPVKIKLVDEWLSPVFVLQMLDLLRASVDSGICYRKLMREDSHIIFSGNAWSLPSVTSSLSKMEKSLLFGVPRLTEVRKNLTGDHLQFEMKAKLSSQMTGD